MTERRLSDFFQPPRIAGPLLDAPQRNDHSAQPWCTRPGCPCGGVEQAQDPHFFCPDSVEIDDDEPGVHVLRWPCRVTVRLQGNTLIPVDQYPREYLEVLHMKGCAGADVVVHGVIDPQEAELVRVRDQFMSRLEGVADGYLQGMRLPFLRDADEQARLLTFWKALVEIDMGPLVDRFIVELRAASADWYRRDSAHRRAAALIEGADEGKLRALEQFFAAIDPRDPAKVPSIAEVMGVPWTDDPARSVP